MYKQKFNVSGMSCSACSSRVEKAVSEVQGVKSVSVNLIKNTMQAEYDENICSPDIIIKSVEQAGYGAQLDGQTKESTATSTAKSNYKAAKIRLVASIVLTIPLFYISMGHMMSWPLQEFFLGYSGAMTFALTQLLLASAIAIINYKYFVNGFKALLHKSPNMDSLIALGSSSALIYGIYAMYKIAYGLGHSDTHIVHSFLHDLYFEGAGTILCLISLGKFFEARAKGKASDAISKLMDLSPKTARVIRDGVELNIDSEDIKLDDIILVKTGESIPTDGIILDGQASIDESMLTGESLPVDKNINEKVIGATIIKSGYIKMQATKLGEDTMLKQIIKLVDDATSSKAPIAKLADKISLYFVPTVIAIAIISFVVWLSLGYSLEHALSMAISVLVISCPCALGLATPTAIMVGSGLAANNAILFKSATALEKMQAIKAIVFDKTGTITEGKPRLINIKYFDKSDKINDVLYSIESLSEHPLAKAIAEYCKNNDAKQHIVENFKQIEARGISATVKGRNYLLGNAKMLEDNNIDIDEYKVLSDEYSKAGKTVLYLADEEKLLSLMAIADKIKDSSIQAIKELKSMGLHMSMITGDNQKTANAIRQQLDIDESIAEVMPQDKETHIRRLKEKYGFVAMVGDGINDAPALARADIGVAIGSGTDIAMETADVVLIKSDLMDVVKAINISKQTLRNIKQNLFWAFIYNVLGIPIAAGVFYISHGIKLNPMIAALAMSFSSVFVVSNALRLKFFGNKWKYKNDKKLLSHEKKEDLIMKKLVKIEGMMCAHCVAHAKKALESLEQVKTAEVDLSKKQATLELNAEIENSSIEKAIEDAGYKVSEINNL